MPRCRGRFNAPTGCHRADHSTIHERHPLPVCRSAVRERQADEAGHPASVVPPKKLTRKVFNVRSLRLAQKTSLRSRS